MKKKKSNQKKFKKEDIFGLKSYTDGAEMWKFITSELDPTNTSISFLNDKSFDNLVAYHLLEAWLAYKKGQITKEQFMECICVGGVTDYLVAFNFCLYSEKADKWYSGIFMCGDRNKHEPFLFMFGERRYLCCINFKYIKNGSFNYYWGLFVIGNRIVSN
jgi:hypothetical protein